MREPKPGRQAKPSHDGDLVLDDQLLSQALSHVRHAGIILDDQLDLLAGNRVALLLHVELGGRLDLPARRRERPGHRQDQTDLERLLSKGPSAQSQRDRSGAGGTDECPT